MRSRDTKLPFPPFWETFLMCSIMALCLSDRLATSETCKGSALNRLFSVYSGRFICTGALPRSPLASVSPSSLQTFLLKSSSSTYVNQFFNQRVLDQPSAALTLKASLCSANSWAFSSCILWSQVCSWSTSPWLFYSIAALSSFLLLLWCDSVQFSESFQLCLGNFLLLRGIVLSVECEQSQGLLTTAHFQKSQANLISQTKSLHS